MNARPTHKRSRGGVAAARRRTGAGTIAGIVVVVVVAVAVVVGLLQRANRTDDAAAAQIPVVTSSAAGAPVAVDKAAAVVTMGKAGAPATIDVYEDFLCPICGQFEHTYGDQIRQAVTDGKLDVRYHVVNLLDDRSDPPGYSMAAASAALAVAEADPGAFASFHDSLYGAQPSEGGRGYDANQLDALATALGVPKGRVADALASKEFDQAVQTSLQTAATNPALRQQTSAGSGFGTPTVAVDGRLVDVSDPNWLTAILAAR
ncbi:DsbA family protein [Pseudonocardia dioxanivorans]|uniref:DsbA family protein n=1 Tax=Pseudonocardia dioxanivorans TaxID=240495 RepID=UPI000CD2FC6E|nr:thioredoxin domain-containing protein [Pseudonocardia dioxanivorans]